MIRRLMDALSFTTDIVITRVNPVCFPPEGARDGNHLIITESL